MDNIDVQKMFYKPFCSSEEIERIFNVKTTDDYLLKIRADAVADHARLYRVMRKRLTLKRESGEWNFTKHFSVYEFNGYLKKLSGENKVKAEQITAGFIFNNEVNGCCMRSEHGDLIIVSESLKFFLYFMNLYFLDFEEIEIPVSVRFSSLTIAIRTMLMTEALDFELDPRGKVPAEVDKIINKHVEKQLDFIIGHEYAHYLLNHLDSRNLIERPIIHMFENNNMETQTYKIYNNSQKQEFEADKAVYELAHYNLQEFIESINSVFHFFLYLDIYRGVIDTISPTIGNYKTHPEPIDRLWNLYDSFEDRINIYIKRKDIESLIEGNQKLIEDIQDDIGYNIETYELYGSLYLEDWRGPILQDRVDY